MYDVAIALQAGSIGMGMGRGSGGGCDGMRARRVLAIAIVAGYRDRRKMGTVICNQSP